MSFLLRPLNTDNPDDSDGIVKIEPTAAFTIKSKLASCSKPNFSLGAKVFINVCYDEQVPKPDVDFNPSIVYPLIMSNRWEIPIVTSQMREDRDKKGSVCYVWDCCINSKCIQWIGKDLQLREILVEWCIESCELREAIEISRDAISFPKMKKKGDHIPAIEVLAKELGHNFEKEIQMFQERKSDPTVILELRRDLLEGEDPEYSDDDRLPPLFPQAAPAEGKKPLIQEIENLTLSPGHAQLQSGSSQRHLRDLNYSVIMGKATENEAKIKIEICSELASPDDYDVTYCKSDNKLVIKNKDLDVHKLKTMEILLPHLVSTYEPRMEMSFIKRENKLSILL
ncbi:LAMI_0D04412g1_1 [Lachancea mirantina]|uniref:LAMI_0D04412g1_1 n=1 Tax=Lachancea mirantina TaxID=1230905 RepID=A0A1G4JAP9_9SACH|nr:LAMI_0D04412g1_1 [Lachancea mirantina]